MSSNRRLKDVWPFSKPKTPGFGIDRGFYLSVLSSVSRLPAIVEILNPEGLAGAVSGFGAPLGTIGDRAALQAPMVRGAYALASPDKKTVLRMLVLPKEEAGFDPEPLLRSEIGKAFSDEMRDRVRATWTLLQLTFEAHDPMVYPSLDFILEIAFRLGAVCEGVIADPVSQTYRMPYQLWVTDSRKPADARNFVTVNLVSRPNGIQAFTLGMQKFALPELEVYEVPPTEEASAKSLLISLCQRSLEGRIVRLGDRFGAARAPFTVQDGATDRGRWEGIACFELVPDRNHSVADSLHAWAEEVPI